MESNFWVKCFSIVTFDEDIGQQVEFQTPSIMSDFQLQALAYLAFPDSNSFSIQGDLFYVFKMKFNPNLYGYTYFRQWKDLSKPRKYSQQSLVLLSEHPYISLFKQVVEILGPLYFEHGVSIFEAVNSCMKIWPENTAGSTLELPILGSIVCFTVPSKEVSFNPLVLAEGLSDILESMNLAHAGLFQDINLCEIFSMNFIKKHLNVLWEILITGEELLFFTESPRTCSLGVLGLVSLLSPILYSGDVYPYFTIFDNDFKIVQNNYERQKNSETVIGATNPYILKAFSEMSNVVQCEGQLCLNVVNIKTSQNSLVNKILNLFEGNTKENFAINNTAIRKHYREMTLAFLHAFHEYLSYDEESIKKMPYFAEPLKSYEESEFLGSLNCSKNIIPFLKYTNKPRAVYLYAKFVKSSTFIKWFAGQRQKSSSEAEQAIRKATVNFDVSSLTGLTSKELKIVHKKIKRRLEYEEKLAEDIEGIEKLRVQLQFLLSSYTPS